ncbi:hypothetical protein [Auraticoccus monumenti]|uniref:Cell division protein FtsL n=1 Tax=Auraticoccus monumenti TaxID=675864 RepID=A0A1G7DMY2_9ACTN|nr:hypothetical protein [Auraticoccus monumenti]SDE52859.1 hypothetical protein SAMN04489747_3655 [Auraticoccus monumenti]
MSALLHLPTPRRSGQEQEAARLRAVSTPPGRLSRVPFLLVLAATLGLGMVGLLVLNTTVQTNAVEVRALEARLTTLSYAEAELESRLDRAESPADLAGKASELGLRPNPYPAFIDLETGEVSGDPREVEGDEMDALVTTTTARPPTGAEQRAAEERAEREEAARDRAAAQERREEQQKDKAEQDKKDKAQQDKKDKAQQEKKDEAQQDKKDKAQQEKKDKAQDKKEKEEQQDD